MELYLKVIVAALFALVVSACSPIKNVAYLPSVSEAPAIVENAWKKETWTSWEGYILVAVDDEFVTYGMLVDKHKATIKVDPGDKKLAVYVKFNKTLGMGPYEAIVPIKASLLPNERYKVNGRVRGDKVEAWLEKASTNEVVGDISSSGFRPMQQERTYAPIFIPTKR